MSRPPSGLLVLIGSGETSPTMVEVHRSAARALGARPRAVLLDTPYAFQENAASISARAREYFARSVGIDVTIGGEVAGADWVFAGPGSPTYALDRWSQTATGADLRARVAAAAGVTVLASAAACTAGIATVPVYEIYKVGAPPHWREGLDLLSPLGLRVVVIPHYDNTEGGTHDTRFCYLGERRLAQMEAELPSDAAVLGIDEHTAVTIELPDGAVTVAGRGGVTIRRTGGQTRLPTGTVIGLRELTDLVRGALGAPPLSPPQAAAAPAPARITLAEVVETCQARFANAIAREDGAGAAQAVLELEDEITTWAADTEVDEGGTSQARERLRLLLARLGGQVRPVAPLVDALLELRTDLRKKGRYDLADSLRTALQRGGVSVEDTPDGPTWSLRKPPA
ncbi:hypothetical protein J5X84_25885 [Streptosporangiaceae bacterium NEAU-GS5]|nr:hypothetical protein [Streptosporangiaceae bacterium NEAU-GS5]